METFGSIKQWVADEKLNVTWITDSVFTLSEVNFLFIERDIEEKIFDSDFNMMLLDEEMDDIDKYGIKRVCFFFGPYVFHTEIEGDTYISILRNIGTSSENLGLGMPRLNIHSCYELLQAQGSLQKLIKRAQFLEIPSLGIADFHTMAGVFEFETLCLQNNIHPVIGVTIAVQESTVQLYCLNQTGWKHISRLTSEATLAKKISLKRLIELSEGLYVVGNISLEKEVLDLLTSKIQYFAVGLDFSEYSSQDRDNQRIETLALLLKKPIYKYVWTQESRYLNKTDTVALQMLINMSGLYIPKSEDQWLKTDEELLSQFYGLFSKSEKVDYYLKTITENTCEIAELSKEFRLNRTRKLPSYIMSKEDLKMTSSKEDLFFKLLERGLDELAYGKEIDMEVYLTRLEKECVVIAEAGLIDYFLIMWDLCKWCKANDILVGVGRGSAAGALLGALLGLTHVDPIEHGLLFERFLNEGRAKTSLPDIDTDIQDDRRDDARNYLSDKYGKRAIANVGNYQEYKMKSALTDALKAVGCSFTETKIATAVIPKEHEEGGLNELIKSALLEPKLKEILLRYPKFIEYFEPILGQPRAAGVHASAKVLVPSDSEHLDFLDWAPVTITEEGLVTQLQGTDIESMGFLKADLLGLSQLTKFQKILKLVEQNTDYKINPYDLFKIDTDDEKVYDYFELGWNEDVFQFGSPSQIQYSQYLQPKTLNELTAANALYRPGPMDSGAHIDYAEIKHGRKQREEFPLLSDIFQDTYGLMCYQEQIMAAFTRIADADMNQSDNFRKFVTKLKGQYLTDDKYIEYQALFIDGYVRKGVSKEIAGKIWAQIIAFTKYSFNKSHALCYAFEGYISQWLKVYYPLEFWTVSLSTSDTEIIPRRIREIKQIGQVSVNGPDINYSDTVFAMVRDKNSIYWSLTSIHGIGDKMAQKIIKEREKKPFTGLEDFIQRAKIPKKIVYSLITVGAFDAVEYINEPIQRGGLIRRAKAEFNDDEPAEQWLNDWTWHLHTFQICKYHNLDMGDLRDFLGAEFENCVFLLPGMLEESGETLCNAKSPIVACGIISSFSVKPTKSGYARLQMSLDQGGEILEITIWGQDGAKFAPRLEKGLLIAFSGKISMNRYSQKYAVQSEYYSALHIFR